MFPQHNLGLFDRADLGSRQTPPVRNGSSNPPGGTSGGTGTGTSGTSGAKSLLLNKKNGSHLFSPVSSDLPRESGFSISGAPLHQNTRTAPRAPRLLVVHYVSPSLLFIILQKQNGRQWNTTRHLIKSLHECFSCNN